MGNGYITEILTSSDILWNMGFVNTIDAAVLRMPSVINEIIKDKYETMRERKATRENIQEERENFIHKF